MKAIVELGNPAEALALLTEQRDLCRRLSGFAETQRSLITGDEPERLLTLLADRQQLLDRLSVVGTRLRPLQQNWREVRAGLSSSQAQAADALIAEVNQLLAGILHADETDAQLLSAKKNATAQSMREVGRGRQAGAAYAATGTAGGTAAARVDWTDE